MLESQTLNYIKAKKIKFREFSFDTRSLKKRDIFFAIDGSSDNGNNFILEAQKKGASLIVVSSKTLIPELLKIPFIRVDNVRKELSLTAHLFYKSNIKTKIAVTGTNGKTSITFFLKYLLTKLNKKTISIGTLGFSNSRRNVNLTSPDPISLFKELKLASSQNHKILVMETSSHGLDQERFFGLKFDLSILTNISHDHLDYHRTMKHYIKSKAKLFTEYTNHNGKTLINADSKHLKAFKSEIKVNKKLKPIYFNLNNNFKVDSIHRSENGTDIITAIIGGEKIIFQFRSWPFFQIQNFLLASVGLYLIGYSIKKIAKLSLNCPYVPGRMEMVGSTISLAKIYVDFAHTPDALKSSLKEARKICKGRLIVLFGCGGDRDKKKRPIMGQIANEYADLAYVTDDNPRTESPKKIREEIINNSKYLIDFGSRENAIKRAIFSLQSYDLLLIAGKGHEDYQIIKNKKYKFSDKEIVKKYLRKYE